VLDHLHLGDRVGQLDDLGRAATAGECDVHMLRARAQGLEHAVERQPAVDQRVGDLVEHHEEEVARQNRGLGLFPAVARQLARAFEILALPAEAVAQAFDGNADLLEHAVLAEARRRHLHELVDLHGLAAAVCAQGEAEGCGALALAVAGVDDDDAAAFAFGLFVGLFAGRGFYLHEGFRSWVFLWCAQATGYFPPRMSPGLRPPP